MAQWEKGPWGSGPLKECPLGKGLWEKGQLEKGKRQAPWLLLSPCCVETSAEPLSRCLPAGTAVLKGVACQTKLHGTWPYQMLGLHTIMGCVFMHDIVYIHISAHFRLDQTTNIF